MTGLFLKSGCYFTDDEKETCKPTVFKLVEFANLARQRGLLALETEILDEQNEFLKTAVNLMLDAIDPVIIKQIFQNLMSADEYTGVELLNRLLIAEGVLSIQQQEHPRITALKLYSMLGEKYIFAASQP